MNKQELIGRRSNLKKKRLRRQKMVILLKNIGTYSILLILLTLFINLALNVWIDEQDASSKESIKYQQRINKE